MIVRDGIQNVSTVFITSKNEKENEIFFNKKN